MAVDQLKNLDEYRKVLQNAQKAFSEFSQKCRSSAVKETDPFKKDVLTNFSLIANQFDDIYSNIEVLAISNHVTNMKIEDTINLIRNLPEVKLNPHSEKLVSDLLSKDYFSTV